MHAGDVIEFCTVAANCTAPAADAVMDCVLNECVAVHKDLFPLEFTDVFSILVTFVAAALAAGGGIGGGGLLVPCFILVAGFEPKEAIPLSKATIFGAAVANFMILSQRKHPEQPHRPLIAYDVALIMEPLTLAGTIVGVYLNKVSPNFVVTVALVWLLTNGGKRTWKKAQKIRAKEKAKAEAGDTTTEEQEMEEKMHKVRLPDDADELADEETTGLLTNEPDSEEEDADVEMGEEDADNTEASGSAGVAQRADGSRITLADLKREESRPPWRVFSTLLFVWVTVFVFSLLKGGHGAPSAVGLECGSVGYWGVVLMSFPVLLYVTAQVGRDMAARHSLKCDLGYKFAEGDVEWDETTVKKYPGMCSFAGVAAGMLGIGGGMVKGPLMLEMGMVPEVSSATSAFMILFTSSCTTMQFLILGMLKPDYASAYALVGFVAAICGQKGVRWVLQEYRAQSAIVFILAITIGSSGVFMGLVGILDMMENGLRGFGSVCGH